MTLRANSIPPDGAAQLQRPRLLKLRGVVLSLTVGSGMYWAGAHWTDSSHPIGATLSSITTGLATPTTTTLPAPDAPGHAAVPVVADQAEAAGSSSTTPPKALATEQQRRIELGRKIFFDTALSEPAGTSCASCHEPGKAYSGNHGSKLGVALGSRPNHYARRNTPSLLYLKYTRKFHWHWDEDAPVPDAVGGFFWDGRADSIKELVRQPLLNADEMGNTSPAQLVSKLRAASYADELTSEYALTWSDAEPALQAISGAVEAFLTSDELSPFSSRYDDFVRGTGKLNEQELRGLALFRDGSKGGCDACHRMSESSPNPERSMFSDFGFEALAVPRNRKLPHNRDRNAYDKGLCEPEGRHFPMDRETWCSNFRTASLRNVAVRESFMHNGVFSSLREVVEFYVTRGTTPKRWYSSGVLFDDVPKRYREQVQVDRVPYDRGARQKPRMDAGEIDAVVAFLKTLTEKAYLTDAADH